MSAAAQIIRLHETGNETMAIADTFDAPGHSPQSNREDAFESLLHYTEGRYIVRCDGIESDIWNAPAGTFED